MKRLALALALVALASTAHAGETRAVFPDIARGHWCNTGGENYLINSGADDQCGGGAEDFDLTDSHMVMNAGVVTVCDLISGQLVRRPQAGMTSYRATLSCEADHEHRSTVTETFIVLRQGHARVKSGR